MVISSLIVGTTDECSTELAAALTALPGVEIHSNQSHKIVITIEAPTVDESHGIATEITQLSGVLTVNLVYCNFADDPTIQGWSKTQEGQCEPAGSSKPAKTEQDGHAF